MYCRLRTLGQWQGRGENGHLVYSKTLQWRVATRQPCLANTCEGMLGHASCPCAHLSDIIVATARPQICSLSDHSVYPGKRFILENLQMKDSSSIFLSLLTYLTRLDSGQCLDISLCQI